MAIATVTRAAPSYREMPGREFALSIAFAIQTGFRETPTVPQLQKTFGMSRATAYRWRAAVKAVKGEA